MNIRAYMKTVTAIEPEWLYPVASNSPLCKISAPMQTPAPSYNPTTDVVECFVKPYYGIHAWELPPVKVSYTVAEFALDVYL